MYFFILMEPVEVREKVIKGFECLKSKARFEFSVPVAGFGR